MKQISITIVESIFAACYWWIIFTIVYAHVIFAGDRNPAQPFPPDYDVIVYNCIVILVGVLVYTILTVIWRQLAKRI
jgi:hypothetical protein